MSWSHTPPPMSPRKPKIQQQSWDGNPTINLYDPNREFYESNAATGASTAIKKSPTNQTRKLNYGRHCLPNPKHQMSDPGTYYSLASSSAVKSPKSPNAQTFEFELSVTPQHMSRSPLKSVAPNRRFYEDTSTSDSAPATLMSSARKYEFGAVSPKFDNPGTNEYCNFTPVNCANPSFAPFSLFPHPPGFRHKEI